MFTEEVLSDIPKTNNTSQSCRIQTRFSARLNMSDRDFFKCMKTVVLISLTHKKQTVNTRAAET